MNKRRKNAPKTKVREVNGFVTGLVYHSARLYFRLRGVKVKAVNKVGAPEKPSIILCNHGSFIDFIYAATLLRKYKPNFIGARLYFYNTCLNRLLRAMGAFPKSMFALDMESTKNSLGVLRGGGILGMMPEARLSTTGRFEDIQPGTFSFIKKSAVAVYTVKFCGDYFADPKWGKGPRRGAVVEAELDLLYTAQQVKELSVQQLEQGIVQRLFYDEFRWLEQHPQIRYRCRRMAEGLENILTTCPLCHKKHTLTTKNRKIFCEKCGYLTSLDSRYHFTDDFLFEDLRQWYDWQEALMEKEISQDPNYALCSEVELRLPGNGKGLTRHGGYGVCALSRDGLVYTGTQDGKPVQLQLSLQKIYRLLFGAGKNFEVYDGAKILYFVPKEKRSAVDWYMASMILHSQLPQSDA